MTIADRTITSYSNSLIHLETPELPIVIEGRQFHTSFNKKARHKLYGKLQPLSIPEKRWQSVSMDFIVKLPISKKLGSMKEYDNMFIIVDWLTKYSYFIPYREDIDAKEFAYLFYRIMTSQYKIPAEIISDRDKLFKSKF